MDFIVTLFFFIFLLLSRCSYEDRFVVFLMLDGCGMSNIRELPGQVLLCLLNKRTCCIPVNMGGENVVHVMNMSVAA